MRRVVVTGMGVISPIGCNIETFFSNLVSGTCGITKITRFDTEGLKVKVAAEVKDFDPISYGMDKNAVRRNDLYCQYAMAAATQAVEQSQILGKINPERFGVYIGSGIGGMNTFIEETLKLSAGGSRKVSPLFIPKMISNIASGNVAIKFGAKGVCIPVVTACATSTHDIGEAYRAIAHGYADAIIAGGAEATLNELAVAGFQNCMALTTAENPLESSLPFDKRRGGFVMGEGAGVVVLEEFEHAKKRGAKILGEMVGYANTCDAYHITAPSPDAEQGARALREAAAQAGYTENTSVYINAHGTGTPLNDKSETLAIKKAFGARAKDMMISSTKSMTGHMLGAAGAVEAIVCIMALQRGMLPPTIGYMEKDPACDLDYIPNETRQVQADIALSVSLGFGGHNGCIAFKKINEG